MSQDSMSQDKLFRGRVKLLLVEDNPGDRDLVLDQINEGIPDLIEVVVAGTLAEAFASVESRPPEVVLLDLSLPDSAGESTYIRMKRAAPEALIVVVTSPTDTEIGVRCVKDGAWNYLIKGRMESGFATIRNALANSGSLKAVNAFNQNLKQALNCSVDATLVVTADGQ